MHFATQFILAHMKIESKISDLGTKISILPRQMTEQMPFDVYVKMVKNRIFKMHFFCSECTLQLNFS